MSTGDRLQLKRSREHSPASTVYTRGIIAAIRWLMFKTNTPTATMIGDAPIGSMAIGAISDESTLRSLLHRVDLLQKEIEKLRPVNPTLLAKIEQRFRLEWNYHSNKIEGNSYTYGETKVFLLHGLTAQGKPLKDSLEIRGHNEAINTLQDIVRKAEQLTETTIRGLHQLILGEPYRISALTSSGEETTKEVVPGRYKREPNHVRTVTGEMFYFSEPASVPAEMQSLLSWYNELADAQTHPVFLAAEFHYRFVRIHPFDDGNGRMARLLMNLILMTHGMPIAIVNTEDKENYYSTLRQADGGDIAAFVTYVAGCVIRSQELWLRGARGESIEDLDKELELAKARILTGYHPNEDESLSRFRSFWHSSIVGLLQEFQSKLARASDMFDRARSHIAWEGVLGDSADLYRSDMPPDLRSPSVESITKYFLKHEDVPNQIDIAFDLSGLKVSGRRGESIRGRLRVQFRGDEAIASWADQADNNAIFVKIESGLDDSQIAELASELARRILTLVNQNS